MLIFAEKAKNSLWPVEILAGVKRQKNRGGVCFRDRRRRCGHWVNMLRRSCYLFMLITCSSMVSTVVMPLELAWKPRWVMIICTNSRDMSTLDCSML